MPKFTRQHYEDVSKIIFSRWSTASALGNGADAMLNLLIADFHELFRADNSNFDGERFEEACEQGPKS